MKTKIFGVIAKLGQNHRDVERVVLIGKYLTPQRTRRFTE